jgi:hypothetical protein
MTNRSPQVNIPPDEVRARVRQYLSDTQRTIITVDDILEFFPEKQREVRNTPDKWKWARTKQAISNFMRKEMFWEWEQISPNNKASRKMWRRRDAPIEQMERTANAKKQNKVSPLPERKPRWINHVVDPEPWKDRLARYREACLNLVVIENGGWMKPSPKKEEART